MALNPSDIFLALPEYNPVDVYRKVGGFHTGREIESDVDSLFQPGIIIGSDSSDSFTYQYRKLFIKNRSGKTLFKFKVWGQNVKSCNYIKFSLERNIRGEPILDGSEIIKDYRTAPSIWNYVYTECGSTLAQQVGSDGIMSDMSAQGVWLRMAIPKNASDLASDIFRFGVEATEVDI